MFKTVNNLKINIKSEWREKLDLVSQKDSNKLWQYDNISVERIIDVVNQSNNKEWSAGYSNSHSP